MQTVEEYLGKLPEAQRTAEVRELVTLIVAHAETQASIEYDNGFDDGREEGFAEGTDSTQ